MSPLAVQFVQHSQRIRIESSAFPGSVFSVTIPEAIGDGAKTFWVNPVEKRIQWEEKSGGRLHYDFEEPGELKYSADVTPGEDWADIEIRLTNLSERTWEESQAFHCYNGAGGDGFYDHELLRTYGGLDGKPIRLIEHPRTRGPRPLIQLYGVKGATPAEDVKFVSGFGSTSPIALEPWLAIEARNGKGVMGVISPIGLYLFDNLEYSCIHACPSFGKLEPGKSAKRLTRVYVTQDNIASFYERLHKEFPEAWGGKGKTQKAKRRA